MLAGAVQFVMGSFHMPVVGCSSREHFAHILSNCLEEHYWKHQLSRIKL